MKCPVCQADTTGAYCPSCGAPVDGAQCRACQSPLLAGARYCVSCGEAVRPAAASASLPWYVAGASLLVLVVALVLPGLRTPDTSAATAQGPWPVQGTAPATSAPAAGAPAAGRAPPLTGTPREQADRLFNRVMQARAQNDASQAEFFMPMAILAYRQAGDLDADGLYHLSVLLTESGDAAGGLATARQVLETAPDHLLALGAAARAAERAGDRAAARGYYEHLLRVYDAEQASGLPEYGDHAAILPEYLNEARQRVAN